MPLINVEGPRVTDIDKKAEFVQKITDVTSEFYGMDKNHIIVLIKENSPENVGVGGELVVRMREK